MTVGEYREFLARFPQDVQICIRDVKMMTFRQTNTYETEICESQFEGLRDIPPEERHKKVSIVLIT